MQNSALFLIILLSYIVNIWSRGVNVIPLPRTNPQTQVQYPLRPGNVCNAPAINPLTITASSQSACGTSQPGAVRDILYAGEPYTFAYLRDANGGTVDYTLKYTGNETRANFNQHVLAASAVLDVPDDKYKFVPVNIPAGTTCSQCVVSAIHTDPTNTNTRYVTCSDVMIVRRSAAYAVFLNTRAPNADYEPVLAENILRAALTPLNLIESQGVHIMRWPTKTDNLLAGTRDIRFEIRFNEVPGLYETGLTTLWVYQNNTAYVQSVLSLNGFTVLEFLPAVNPPTGGAELPVEQLVCNQIQLQRRVLSPTEANTIAAAVLLSVVMIGFLAGAYFIRPKLHKSLTGSSKGFTYVQLAGGVTLVNLIVAILSIVCLTSEKWATDDAEYMGLFQKCQTSIGRNYGNNGAYCVSLDDLSTNDDFLSVDGKNIEGAESLEAVKAFVILAVIPLVLLFFWSASSLFTRNFLKHGLHLAYVGILAMASSFLAICIFGAWYNDVWAKFAEFHQESDSIALGWGYWICFALIPGSFVAFGASLSLAGKQGDGTTTAAVTRNWGDAPFSGKQGMAEGGGSAPPATAPRPSVPVRPNTNRAPATAPRPAGGWFSKTPAKPQLAPGWQEVKSKEGDTYYWNSATNESTWDVPLATSGGAPPPRPPAPGATAARGAAPLTRQGSGRSGRGGGAGMEI